MGRLRNATIIPFTYLRIIKNINNQKKYLKQYIEPIISEYEKHSDGSLSEKDFIKIRKYYGLAVPAILGESFCILRGKPMTRAERKVTTSQGIITGLFDDFFDDKELSDKKIDDLVFKPESVKANTNNERLFLRYYIDLLTTASHPQDVKKYLSRVYDDQIKSLEQENKEISEERIWEITKDKGGNSVLFYRSAFDHIMDELEEETMYNLGALMQFENDIFDVYKDVRDKINTIPTTNTNVFRIKDHYENLRLKFIDSAYKMNYSQVNIIRFLDIITPVINRGYVCLYQYQQLENNSNGIFNPTSYSREQLICDMEKPVNIFRTIYYQIKKRY